MEQKPNLKETFLVGIIKENPVFVGLLAMCPTLGVTSSVTNGVGMGVITTLVLCVTNLIISAIRKITPDEVRIPVFIVAIATTTTVMELLMAAFMPDLHSSLGLFLSLVVTNCIILGRAEAFASKNGIVASLADAAGCGVGFTLALIIISFFRELFGTGIANFLFFKFRLIPEHLSVNLFIQPAGAFIMLGIIIGVIGTAAVRKDSVKKLKLIQAKRAADAAKLSAQLAQQQGDM